MDLNQKVLLGINREGEFLNVSPLEYFQREYKRRNKTLVTKLHDCCMVSRAVQTIVLHEKQSVMYSNYAEIINKLMKKNNTIKEKPVTVDNEKDKIYKSLGVAITKSTWGYVLLDEKTGDVFVDTLTIRVDVIDN